MVSFDADIYCLLGLWGVQVTQRNVLLGSRLLRSLHGHTRECS